MILMILFIIALILGFTLIFICDKKNWDLIFPALLMVIGVCGCLVGGSLIPCERSANAYNSYYREWNRKYLGLEARIEAWNKGVEDPYLWDDVKEFNSDLKEAQHWANSYWTNWMKEQACNEFKSFDIPDYERSYNEDMDSSRT